MRNCYATVLAAGLFALAASPAIAQPPGGGRFGAFEPTPAMLLGDEKVRTELKLTDDQTAEFKKIRDKYQADLDKAREDMDRKKGQDLRKAMSDEIDKALPTVLKPEQTKRLNQLVVQRSGLGAFAKDDVATALKLTDKQKKEVADAKSDIEKDSADLFKDAAGDREKMGDAFKKVQTMQTDALTKVMDSLTDDQKKTWKDLTGDKFEFSPFGGRRPGTEEKPKDK